MKKYYVLGMALIASLAFCSCSNDSDLEQGGINGSELAEQDGQVLSLCVDNGGDGLTTRAGRPLLSSQAKQQINHIDLYVVDKNTTKLVLKKTVGADEWVNASDYSNASGHGKQIEIAFRKSLSQDLKASAEGVDYTIYAVGYETPADAYTTIVDISDAPATTTEGVAFDKTKLFALLNESSAADEIFAGEVAVSAITVDKNSVLVPTAKKEAYKTDKKKIVPALVLNRQVAGVTGYFTNLPAKVGDQMPAKLRLIASNKSDKLHFSSLVSGETDNNTAAAATNIVNGDQSKALTTDLSYAASANKGFKVYEIDLKEFFPQLKADKNFVDLDLDKDGYVGFKDAQFYVYGKTPSEKELENWAKDVEGNTTTTVMGGEYNGKTKALSGFWKNPNDKKQRLVAGSIYAGNFLIPFALKNNTNTFELQLLDAKGNTLKSWNIQVPATTTAGAFAEGISTAFVQDASALVYNVYRNHLYSMGLKASDLDKPLPGEKPDPDPEHPQKPVVPKPNPDPQPGQGGGDNTTDKPEDLSKGEDLLINVNDNWEIVHDMIID